MKPQKLFHQILFIILLPCCLLAWGHAGHTMVVELAMSMLSDATKVKVERVLGGMSAADAGNWMDEVRSDLRYKYTAPWHYVNIEPGGSYQPAVCGKVYSTRALNNGPTFLNMGADYPDNPFTAVIMFDKRSSFSYKPEEYLKGKTICITGIVKNYKGKSEIVVEKEVQIRLQ